MVINSPYDSSAIFVIEDLGRPIIRELSHLETSVMTYNRLNELAPNGCISKLSDYLTRDHCKYAIDKPIPRKKTSYGQQCFAFSAGKGWSYLDLVTKLVPVIYSFKTTLKATKIESKVSFVLLRLSSIL